MAVDAVIEWMWGLSRFLNTWKKSPEEQPPRKSRDILTLDFGGNFGTARGL